MSSHKVLFGFHAIGVRLKIAPQSVVEIHYELSRRDARMRQFIDKARDAGMRLVESDGERLAKLAGGHGHQGVVAMVVPMPQNHSLDDLLDTVQGPPLLLVLDGVTDPHNLGACLRVADGAGAHAVIASHPLSGRSESADRPGAGRRRHRHAPADPQALR